MKRTYPIRTQRMPFKPARAIVVGLGPIGLEVATNVLLNDAFRFCGAVDAAPHLQGRSLRELLGDRAPAGRVLADARAPTGGEGIAFVTTTSSLRSVLSTVENLLQLGYHVVSSTEELSYPPLRSPRLAARLERAAKKAGRAVVGTGINPGYAMDVWPLILASNMQRLDAIRVTRIVNASQRRQPLQRKIGSGMSRAEFEALAREGRIGHVGLVESAAHLAAALGWSLDTLNESLTPKIATQPLRTQFFEVPKGRVCGIHHRVTGRQGRRQRVDLDLQMYLGATDPRDEVELIGSPPLRCVVPGGFHGDRTTTSQLLAAGVRITAMPPGLHLASDLPAPRWATRPVRLTFAQRPADERSKTSS